MNERIATFLARAASCLCAYSFVALTTTGCLLIDAPAALNQAGASGDEGTQAGSAGSGTGGESASGGRTGNGGSTGEAGEAPDGSSAGSVGEAGAGGNGAGGNGGGGTVDPCAGVVCDTPPASDCVSSAEFKSFDMTGTCTGGKCSYVSHAIACTCSNHVCSTDPCLGLTCETPAAASCKDQNTLTQYASQGVCAAGDCSYTPTEMSCAFGCSAGACNPDPCNGKVCNTQPSPVCADASTLTQFDATGSCTAGQCSYTSSHSNCAFGCASGACKADPCAGVACTTPPVNDCTSSTQYKSYDTTGSCTAGTCSYPVHTTSCNCQNHACITDPCQTVTCASPPAATCKNTSTLTKYASLGTCSAGSCSYAGTDSTCSFGCENGGCKADPCLTVTCSTPPSASCSGSTLTTYAAAGSCSAGTCTYKAASTTCQFGCSGGACKPDPCASVTCKTPPAATCSNSTHAISYASTGTCSAGACSYSSTTTTCAANQLCSSGACKTVPAPVIASFQASYAQVCAGSKVNLTATFSNGTATIDNGVGTINSGASLAATLSARTTFTLTVTNAVGQQVTATQTVAALSRGAFTPTGALPAARVRPGSALLADGRALFAGGAIDNDSADLYDPVTGSFTRLSRSMNTPRSQPMVSVLNDGRVLIGGGYGAGSLELSSAETFSASSGVFTATGSFAVPRYVGTFSTLASGKVLAAGGRFNEDSVTSTADLFNPSAGTNGTFSATLTPMVSARFDHSATLLASGSVLLAGGCTDDSDDPCPVTSSAELYDPTGNRFTNGPAMLMARLSHAAVLLGNGKVLLAGGYGSDGVAHPNSELYDPSSNTFTATGSMQSARFGQMATVLPSGKVLIMGGEDDSGTILSSAELYDPATGAFSLTGSMSAARFSGGAILLSSIGAVLVAGGGTSTTAELYCP